MISYQIIKACKDRLLMYIFFENPSYTTKKNEIENHTKSQAEIMNSSSFDMAYTKILHVLIYAVMFDANFTGKAEYAFWNLTKYHEYFTWFFIKQTYVVPPWSHQIPSSYHCLITLFDHEPIYLPWKKKLHLYFTIMFGTAKSLSSISWSPLVCYSTMCDMEALISFQTNSLQIDLLARCQWTERPCWSVRSLWGCPPRTDSSPPSPWLRRTARGSRTGICQDNKDYKYGLIYLICAIQYFNRTSYSYLRPLSYGFVIFPINNSFIRHFRMDSN